MDRGSRNYLIFLTVLVAGLLVIFLYEDPMVSKLNDMLEEDLKITSFPYAFRVVRVDDGVATLSTPRSTDVPVEQVMGILFPKVAGCAPDSAEFQKAQQHLAAVQTRVRELILAEPGVKRISWQLDRNWLTQHGLVLYSHR